MRKFALVAIAALAGCSGGAENEADSAPAVVELQPGQWEMTSEVTQIQMAQKAAPTGPIKAGTKVTTTNCITKEQIKEPDANLFAGSKGACKYDNFYMSGGILNAQMNCSQPGMERSVFVSVIGNYTGTTMDATSDVTTYVANVGDMKMSSKVTGKRIGECTAAPEAPAKTS